MIPKIIHYCWFGHNRKPRSFRRCLKSWKKYCSDYQIIEWNEKNYDIAKAPLYVQQAYEAKKWAFVTDYVRLDVVYRNGGIYLDTDVELLHNLDSFLPFAAFWGMEETLNVNTGLGFGAVAGEVLVGDLLQSYETMPFIKPDGTMDITPCPMVNNPVFVRYGLINKNMNQTLSDGSAVFSSEYFCPKSYSTKQLVITANTVSIHHFEATWHDKAAERKIKREKRKNHFLKTYLPPIKKLGIAVLGEKTFNRVKGVMLRHH